VGGVGDEGALYRKGRLQAREQPVQFVHQRLDLERKVDAGQRAQAAGVAALHLRRHLPQRRQPATDDPCDKGDHDGQEQDQRYHDPQCRRASQRLADALRLGDLNHALRSLQPVGAPLFAAQGEIRVADHHLVDHGQSGSREINPRAEQIPDLHDEIRIGLVGWNLDARRHRDLPAQGQRHLAQLIVE